MAENDTYPDTPECDLLTEVAPKSQVIGEFMEWLHNEKEITCCQWVEDDALTPGRYHAVCINLNEYLAEFFGIDLNKVEEERREVLEYLRREHGDKPTPSATMTVTAGDEVEVIEIEGDMDGN